MAPPKLLTLARLFSVAVALGACACSLVTPRFNRPSVSVVSVQMRSSNVLQQNFAVELAIQNPNDRPLPVRGVQAALVVGGEPIASGVSDRAFVVPARGASTCDMTITANMALVLIKLAQMSRSESTIDYQISGSANLDLAFLHALPFRQSGSLTLAQIR